MELKTKVNAEDGKQELVITREFDLPLELLFKAYAEPGIVAQWMGTKVLKLENKKHGNWQFETTDAKGNIVFQANGVIHEKSNKKELSPAQHEELISTLLQVLSGLPVPQRPEQ